MRHPFPHPATRSTANPFRLVTKIFLLVLVVTMPLSAETVTLQLASGRRFTAEIDRRSNEHHLWLRFGYSGATLLRPIDWETIEQAVLDAEPLSISALRELAAATAAGPAQHQGRPGDEEALVPQITSTAAPASKASADLTHAEQARAVLAMTPQVHAIHFDAQMVNWDADVESDGLLMHLYPLDQNGHLVAVDAVVTVELFAAEQRKFHEAPHSRGVTASLVARWTEQLDAQQVGAAGAVFKLPLSGNHPEWDTRLNAYGLVHVRIAAAGHGVFEHSLDGVRLRPIAPLRDLLERSGGERFLPVERTGR